MRAWLSPPAPVTVAVHGVFAEPSYATPEGQLTVVVDEALAIVNVFESLLPL